MMKEKYLFPMMGECGWVAPLVCMSTFSMYAYGDWVFWGVGAEGEKYFFPMMDGWVGGLWWRRRLCWADALALGPPQPLPGGSLLASVLTLSCCSPTPTAADCAYQVGGWASRQAGR